MNTFVTQSKIIDTKLQDLERLASIYMDYYDLRKVDEHTAKVGENLGDTINRLVLDVIKDIEDRSLINTENIDKEEDKPNKKVNKKGGHFYNSVSDEALEDSCVDELMKYCYGDDWSSKYTIKKAKTKGDFDGDTFSELMNAISHLGHH